MLQGAQPRHQGPVKVESVWDAGACQHPNISAEGTLAKFGKRRSKFKNWRSFESGFEAAALRAGTLPIGALGGELGSQGLATKPSEVQNVATG